MVPMLIVMVMMMVLMMMVIMMVMDEDGIHGHMVSFLSITSLTAWGVIALPSLSMAPSATMMMFNLLPVCLGMQTILRLPKTQT